MPCWAPSASDFVSSIPPGCTGGNIDDWRIGKGARMYHPLLQTDELRSVYGFTDTNYLAALGPDAQTQAAAHSRLDPAMRDAFRELRRFLMTVHKLSEDEAIALLSVAADFGVTQVVDGHRHQLPRPSLPRRRCWRWW